MKFLPYISLILLLCPASLCGQPQVPSGKIIVNIKTLKSRTGLARVSLYDKEEGFPVKSEKAFKTIVIDLEKGAARAVFSDIPYGEYALAVLHDENRNGRMDFSWMMLPKEGFGASNIIKKRFMPPPFKDASFVFNSGERRVTILMYY